MKTKRGMPLSKDNILIVHLRGESEIKVVSLVQEAMCEENTTCENTSHAEREEDGYPSSLDRA